MATFLLYITLFEKKNFIIGEYCGNDNHINILFYYLIQFGVHDSNVIPGPVEFGLVYMFNWSVNQCMPLVVSL